MLNYIPLSILQGSTYYLKRLDAERMLQACNRPCSSSPITQEWQKAAELQPSCHFPGEKALGHPEGMQGKKPSNGCVVCMVVLHLTGLGKQTPWQLLPGLFQWRKKNGRLTCYTAFEQRNQAFAPAQPCLPLYSHKDCVCSDLTWLTEKQEQKGFGFFPSRVNRGTAGHRT